MKTGWIAGVAILFAAYLLSCGLGSALFDMPAVKPGSRPLKGGSIALSKDPEIWALGTSLTLRGVWPDQLAADLTACSGATVKVRRIAKYGAPSRWGLAALRDALAQGKRPDLLLVEFASADATLLKGAPLWFSRRSHETILSLAARHRIPVYLMTMNPAHGENWWERPGLSAYNALYREFAARPGGPGLIDIRQDWDALSDDARRRLIPDGVHPSKEGALTVTLPAIERSLTPLFCRPGNYFAPQNAKFTNAHRELG